MFGDYLRPPLKGDVTTNTRPIFRSHLQVCQLQTDLSYSAHEGHIFHTSLSGGLNLYWVKAEGELQTLVLWGRPAENLLESKDGCQFSFPLSKNVVTDLFLPK